MPGAKQFLSGGTILLENGETIESKNETIATYLFLFSYEDGDRLNGQRD